MNKNILKIMAWLIFPYIMIGILISKKTNKLVGVASGFICFTIMISILNTPPAKESTINNTKPTEKIIVEIAAKPTANPQEIYNKWVKSQFSAWDGSCSALVNLLKQNLNDPDSFEHVETKYATDPDLDTLTVVMKYRAKNGFNGKMLSSCIAVASKSKDTITITSIQ